MCAGNDPLCIDRGKVMAQPQHACPEPRRIGKLARRVFRAEFGGVVPLFELAAPLRLADQQALAIG